MKRGRIKWEERAEDEERPRASRQSPDIDAGAATTHLPVRIAGHGDYDAIQIWKAGLPASFGGAGPHLIGQTGCRSYGGQMEVILGAVGDCENGASGCSVRKCWWL